MGHEVMTYVGRDEVRRYDWADNFRQTPEEGPRWQDSTWLQWWDLENGLGGVHRIGHEYNIDGGPTVHAWTNLITPAGILKKGTALPLREADALDDGWGSGDDTEICRIVGDEFVWTIDDAESGVSARLTFTDFHGAFSGWPLSGQSIDDITAHHIDVSGPVTGHITVPDPASGGSQEFTVNGMGLRDRGWGHRDLLTILSHRYVTGCFGPDLSFCAYAIHNGNSDTIETFGWAVKNDTVVYATDIDIVAYAEVDSVSTRGGHIRMDLADGDVVDCELAAVAPGLANVFPNGFLNVNTLCRAESGDRVGTGHFEDSVNVQQGSRKPARLQRALVANGFYPGSPADLGRRRGENFLDKIVL